MHLTHLQCPDMNVYYPTQTKVLFSDMWFWGDNVYTDIIPLPFTVNLWVYAFVDPFVIH